jgi:hypothetical protein
MLVVVYNTHVYYKQQLDINIYVENNNKNGIKYN